MHIAICDDNVADRKQLERLLGRESDNRADSTGVLYVDSFGNPDHMLHNPMLYDLFFIDITQTNGMSGLIVVQKLVEAGVTADFVMCCGDIDYRHQDFPENTFFIDKAIKVAALRSVLDQVIDKQQNRVSHIELRSGNETYYLSEEDILYAIEDSQFTTVYLYDGREIKLRYACTTLFDEIESEHPTFVMPALKFLLNCRYIKEFKPFRKVVMSNGTVFKLKRSIMEYTRKMYAETHT